MLFKFIKIIIDDEANVHATGWPARAWIETNDDEYLHTYPRRIDGVEYRVWCNHALSAVQVDYFIHVVANSPTWVQVDLRSGSDGC